VHVHRSCHILLQLFLLMHESIMLISKGRAKRRRLSSNSVLFSIVKQRELHHISKDGETRLIVFEIRFIVKL
jgi:hypothetical protein